MSLNKSSSQIIQNNDRLFYENKIFSIIKVRNKKKWTKEEDEKLIKLAERNKERHWKDISKNFKNKNPLQCFSRYKRIKPGIIKGTWSREEDNKIISLVDIYGKSWSKIAKIIKSRNGKQIRDRYINVLDPDVKKGKFSYKEDKKIRDLYLQHGPRWATISRGLPNRTPDMIKNRFHSSIKKFLYNPNYFTKIEKNQTKKSTSEINPTNIIVSKESSSNEKIHKENSNNFPDLNMNLIINRNFDQENNQNYIKNQDFPLNLNMNIQLKDNINKFAENRDNVNMINFDIYPNQIQNNIFKNKNLFINNIKPNTLINNIKNSPYELNDNLIHNVQTGSIYDSNRTVSNSDDFSNDEKDSDSLNNKANIQVNDNNFEYSDIQMKNNQNTNYNKIHNVKNNISSITDGNKKLKNENFKKNNLETNINNNYYNKINKNFNNFSGNKITEEKLINTNSCNNQIYNKYISKKINEKTKSNLLKEKSNSSKKTGDNTKNFIKNDQQNNIPKNSYSIFSKGNYNENPSRNYDYTSEPQNNSNYPNQNNSNVVFYQNNSSSSNLISMDENDNSRNRSNYVNLHEENNQFNYLNFSESPFLMKSPKCFDINDFFNTN